MLKDNFWIDASFLLLIILVIACIVLISALGESKERENELTKNYNECVQGWNTTLTHLKQCSELEAKEYQYIETYCR